MCELTEFELMDIAEQVTSFGRECYYTLTDGELRWLDFMRGRYAICDYLDERMQHDGRTVVLDDGISQALDDDYKGYGKAVCLSDDTCLQAIFFYCYLEPEEYFETGEGANE